MNPTVALRARASHSYKQLYNGMKVWRAGEPPYVEAALAGKPVVGASSGGAAKAVLDRKTGLLVETASAIVQLLENPTVATQLGEVRQQCARTYCRNAPQAIIQLGLGAQLHRSCDAPATRTAN